MICGRGTCVVAAASQDYFRDAYGLMIGSLPGGAPERADMPRLN